MLAWSNRLNMLPTLRPALVRALNISCAFPPPSTTRATKSFTESKTISLPPTLNAVGISTSPEVCLLKDLSKEVAILSSTSGGRLIPAGSACISRRIASDNFFPV